MCEAEEVPHNLSLELQPGIWNWKPFVENVTQWLHFTENAPGGERVASHDKFVADPQLHSQLPGISPGTFLCGTLPHFRIRPLPGPSLCLSHSHFGWQETALEFTCLSLRVELLNGDTTFSFLSFFPAFYIPGSVQSTTNIELPIPWKGTNSTS